MMNALIAAYHPPKDFSYTLTAAGKQQITAYPYVPFAGLMHRGFRAVDTKVKVKFKIHAWNWELGCDDEWHCLGFSGHFWNPWKWGLYHKEWEEAKWIDSVVFKNGDENKTIPFE